MPKLSSASTFGALGDPRLALFCPPLARTVQPHLTVRFRLRCPDTAPFLFTCSFLPPSLQRDPVDWWSRQRGERELNSAVSSFQLQCTVQCSEILPNGLATLDPGEHSCRTPDLFTSLDPQTKHNWGPSISGTTRPGLGLLPHPAATADIEFTSHSLALAFTRAAGETNQSWELFCTWYRLQWRSMPQEMEKLRGPGAGPV